MKKIILLVALIILVSSCSYFEKTGNFSANIINDNFRPQMIVTLVDGHQIDVSDSIQTLLQSKEVQMGSYTVSSQIAIINSNGDIEGSVPFPVISDRVQILSFEEKSLRYFQHKNKLINRKYKKQNQEINKKNSSNRYINNSRTSKIPQKRKPESRKRTQFDIKSQYQKNEIKINRLRQEIVKESPVKKEYFNPVVIEDEEDYEEINIENIEFVDLPVDESYENPVLEIYEDGSIDEQNITTEAEIVNDQSTNEVVTNLEEIEENNDQINLNSDFVENSDDNQGNIEENNEAENEVMSSETSVETPDNASVEVITETIEVPPVDSISEVPVEIPTEAPVEVVSETSVEVVPELPEVEAPVEVVPEPPVIEAPVEVAPEPPAVETPAEPSPSAAEGE